MGETSCTTIQNPLFALVFISACGIMQGTVITGLVAVETNIERRFKLKSTEVAWLISAFHLVQCLLQPLVAYWGGKGHQPRWISIGMMGMGVITMLLTIPHFTTGTYQPIEQDVELCNVTANVTSQCDDGSGLRYYLIHFVVLQILNGAMNVPLITLGLAYLYKISPNGPLYQGVFFSTFVIGGALGYLVGGSTLRIPTDPLSSHLEETSPLWVGAWWIGFLAVGAFTFLVAIPVLFLPREDSEVRGMGFESLDIGSFACIFQKHFINIWYHVMRFMAQLRELLVHPAFFLLTLVATFDYGTFSGITTFLPKFMQSNFHFSAGEANLWLGLVSIVGGVSGQVLSGLIVKKFDFGVKDIIKLLGISSCILIGIFFGFLLSCPSSRVADPKDLTCSDRCKCSLDRFEPVCGHDQVTYFSPCFAGCLDNDAETYYNCSCVHATTNNSGSITDDFTLNRTSVLGECKNPRCYSGYVSVVFLLFATFFHLGSFVSAIQAAIKVIENRDVTFFAVGVMWVFIRLLGMFPFPLIYAEFFKLACKLWSTECGETANCIYYENGQLRLSLLLLLSIQKVINIILLACAHFIHGRRTT